MEITEINNSHTHSPQLTALQDHITEGSHYVKSVQEHDRDILSSLHCCHLECERGREYVSMLVTGSGLGEAGGLTGRS